MVFSHISMYRVFLFLFGIQIWNNVFHSGGFQKLSTWSVKFSILSLLITVLFATFFVFLCNYEIVYRHRGTKDRMYGTTVCKLLYTTCK